MLNLRKQPPLPYNTVYIKIPSMIRVTYTNCNDVLETLHELGIKWSNGSEIKGSEITLSTITYIMHRRSGGLLMASRDCELVLGTHTALAVLFHCGTCTCINKGSCDDTRSCNVYYGRVHHRNGDDIKGKTIIF